jgi:hypothetical protein
MVFRFYRPISKNARRNARVILRSKTPSAITVVFHEGSYPFDSPWQRRPTAERSASCNYMLGCLANFTPFHHHTPGFLTSQCSFNQETGVVRTATPSSSYLTATPSSTLAIPSSSPLASPSAAPSELASPSANPTALHHRDQSPALGVTKCRPIGRTECSSERSSYQVSNFQTKKPTKKPTQAKLQANIRFAVIPTRQCNHHLDFYFNYCMPNRLYVGGTPF